MIKTLKKIEDLYNIQKLRTYYIKLGSGGNNAFNKQHILDNNFYIGFRADYQDILDSLNTKKITTEDFKMLVKQLNLSNNQASRSLGVVYEDCGDILWITELNGMMYFGFTDNDSKFEPTNIENINSTKLNHGAVKRMIKWENRDINGNILYTSSISGKISKTFKTRNTIAEIKTDVHEYLISRLFLRKTFEKKRIEELLIELRNNVKVLIQQLNERDFEMLIEIIFLEKGYKKISQSGGNERNYDLALSRPFDDECNLPTFVQVKASADLNVIKEVFTNFVYDQVFGGFNKTGYIAVHTLSLKEKISELKDSDWTLKILDINFIAEEVINYGKYNWLLERTS